MKFSSTMQAHHGVSTPTDLSSLAPSIPFLKVKMVSMEEWQEQEREEEKKIGGYERDNLLIES